MFDLYIWLGIQFPKHFIELKEVSGTAVQASLLIHAGIQRVGVLAYRTEKMRRKAKKSKNFGSKIRES